MVTGSDSGEGKTLKSDAATATPKASGPAASAKTTAPQPHAKALQKRSRKWPLVLIALLVLTASVFQFRARRNRTNLPLDGYITDATILDREYSRYYGKKAPNLQLEAQFKEAAAMMLRRDYPKAVALLENAARQAALPVVFNDLGVLYAEMDDRGRAVYAFREALARDGSYSPVRDNFERYKDLIRDTTDPLTREIEPNDSTSLANPIALDKAVEAEIAASTRDTDTFRFNSPPPPRDILELELSNRSATLIPAARMYDSDDRVIDLGKIDAAAGSSFTRHFSPAPNTAFFLKLSGSRYTGGAYFLTIKPRKAFDAFEPNDDIFSARSIGTVQSVEANIMDAEDTDYYSFVAPRTGALTIEIRNRSTTLIPALTTFNPDRRNSGFGPDLRMAGADLNHRIEVQQNQTYYLQVWSQANSSGSYTLKLN